MFRLARSHGRALLIPSRRPAACLRAAGLPTATVTAAATATTIPRSLRQYAATTSRIQDDTIEYEAGEAEPPKRRRRVTKKTTDAELEPVEEVTKPRRRGTAKKTLEDEAEEIEKPKRGRRREVEDEDSKATEEVEKPKRKYTPRRKTTVGDTEQVEVPRSKRATTTKIDDSIKPSEEQRVLRSGVINYYADHPVARELLNTGLWTTTPRTRMKTRKVFSPTNRRSKKKSENEAEEDDARNQEGGKALPNTDSEVPEADRSRIHIVNENLVKETIDFLAPTLKRHEGCDLVSLNPGAGVWDKALHEVVKPRSHLLLEPEASFYQPFLQPLLDKEGVSMLPQSGIVWDDLNKILTPKYFPHQVEVDRDPNKPIPRNDTLLVTMNLAMNPKKRFGVFDSVSRLVMYQLLQSMRTSTLFQKYGQVRMLIWIPDDEKAQLIPRNVFHRTKLAIQGELTTEYMAEVVSHDKMLNPIAESKKSEKLRYGQMDLESVRQALVKMRDNGYTLPAGRKSYMVQQFEQLGLDLDTPISLTTPITIQDKTTEKEYQYLLALKDAGKVKEGSNDFTRLRRLGHYHSRQDREETRLFDFIRRYDAVTEAYLQAQRSIKPEMREKKLAAARKAEMKLDAERSLLSLQMKAYTIQARDQLHMMRQPPELGNVLTWDRRPFEPLVAFPTDFFPNVPSCLLDIQPKPAHPLLRQAGPGSNNAGDIFDLVLSTLLWASSGKLTAGLDQVWPGAQAELAPRLKLLRDPKKGGVPHEGAMALTVRIVNTAQLIEVVEEFMNWPFRPAYPELVGRLADVNMSEEAVIPASTPSDEAMGPLKESFNDS
ncbi:hypothetical protein BD289DRAFT_438819 [Coniella lustricola]|uniref:rRNA adenine N(6)-methyltransferase n=1 Tax=Coniella lustricola TaxID=2025994 RepID=A0A2T3A2J2_9PEZI|nr:hypothetical protein BD289DRAFT_438819 [Coniella lustricola]